MSKKQFGVYRPIMHRSGFNQPYDLEMRQVLTVTAESEEQAILVAKRKGQPAPIVAALPDEPPKRRVGPAGR